MIGRIAVVGSWHLAGVMAAGLAELGHEVIGWDEDPAAIRKLVDGKAPADEPGLGAAFEVSGREGRLRWTTEIDDALRRAVVVFVAHDTPVGEDDAADLSVVDRSVTSIVDRAEGPLTIAISSQVPVGTTRRYAEMARLRRPELGLDVVCVPEFLELGHALERFRNPDRLVIGCDRSESADVIRMLFPADVRILQTSPETAEMIKHASNAFLATSISFINEVADICEQTGADAVAVANALRLDRRVGPHAFLSPGLGFAGGTLGRDVRALQAIAHRSDQQTRLLDAVVTVNESRLDALVSRIRGIGDGHTTPTACLLGLTYKAGTSTLRRSAALKVARDLLRCGWRVRAHDPAAQAEWSTELPAGLELCPDPYAAALDATLTVLLTDWPHYRGLSLDRLRASMAGDWLIDARNFIDPRDAAAAGLQYWGMGRRLIQSIAPT